MEEKNIKEKADEAYEFMQKVKEGKIKVKELRIPRKAKVGRSKRKKGYVGILKIDENGNISGEKHRLNESAFELKKGTYHGSDGREILNWNGKFPVLIQPTWANSPLDIRKEKSKDETYGQPYIKAKLLKSILVKKKTGGNIIIWVVVIIAAIIGYSLLKGGA